MPDANDPISNTATNIAVIQQLAQVQGQLATIVQLVQQQGDSTNKRIDDFRQATDVRFSGIETRLGTLETNERGTAMRTAAVGALSGAIVSAGLALLKLGGR